MSDDKKDILHLMTQRNQPYGSTRRCCEVCGRMIANNSLPENEDWTSEPKEYDDAVLHGYRQCGG